MILRLTHFAIAALGLSLAACSPPPQQTETPATTVETANTSSVVISAPASGARVTSPLVVEGTAPGDWYFEAQFPAKLVGADGAVIAQAPAISQSDWMTEAPVPYRAQLSFSVTQDTPATLVLQEDMPADNASPRETSIPVVLVPAP
jgi:Immunoglobulin-like domain of bacterial spore germination